MSIRFRSLQATPAALLCITLLTAASRVHAVEPEHTHSDGDEVEVIVVTPSPLGHAPEELSVPVNLVDRDHLLSHSGTTVGEILRSEPGITTSSFASGASRPIIRGQESFRVRVLEDGVGTHDVSPISADHGVPVNPLSAQRVEVVRGPATLRYGGGAIAGVVNSITGRVPRQAFEQALSGELYTAYDTGSRGRTGAVLLEGSLGPVSYHLDGLTADTDDYDTPGRFAKQRNTDTDAWSGAAGLALIGEAGRLGVGYSRFENFYGIPLGEDDSEAVSIDLDRKSWDFEADLYEPFAGLREARFRGRYTDYDHDEVESGRALSTFDNDEWEGRVELLHAPLGGMRGAFGLHHREADLDAGGEGAELLAPTETELFAGYVYEDLGLAPGWTLHLGARVEDVEVEGTPVDDRRRSLDFTPLSGAVGLLVEAHEHLSVGLQLSATQRAPEALELFARGPHEADSTFQIGDPDFDEETSYTADLTLRSRWERLELEASIFYTDYDDFIYGRLTGNTCEEDGSCIVGPGNELDELVYRQEDAYFVGGELTGRLRIRELFGGQLGLDAQLDMVRARLDDSGNVPRITPMRWGGGLWFDHPRVRARLGFLHHEEQTDTAPFEESTSGFTSVDGSARIRLYQGLPGVDLVVSARNLLNAKGRNHASLNARKVVLPGRSVRLGLNMRF